MIRRILPLAMLVMLAVLALVFTTGKERQFAAAASRLPSQVLGKAQSLQSDVKGTVVILQDIVAEEIEDDDVEQDEPMVLEIDEPDEADGGTGSLDGADRTDGGVGVDRTDGEDSAAEPVGEAEAGVDG